MALATSGGSRYTATGTIQCLGSTHHHVLCNPMSVFTPIPKSAGGIDCYAGGPLGQSPQQEASSADVRWTRDGHSAFALLTWRTVSSPEQRGGSMSTSNRRHAARVIVVGAVGALTLAGSGAAAAHPPAPITGALIQK